MIHTTWAWREYEGKFTRPEGITLLALAFRVDERIRATGSPGFVSRWWTARELAQLTGINTDTTTEHLRVLLARGLVERAEGERQGARVTYRWRLAQVPGVHR